MFSTEIQRIIDTKSDWRSVLESKPYHLRIREDDNGHAIFSYNQINSDFNYRVVREARGIIIHIPTNTVVCRAFDKFGNLGESYAPSMDDIDWKHASVLEKLDGSIIKFWVDKTTNIIKISTNGAIDASYAEIGDGKNFYDLVESAPEYSPDVRDIVSRNPDGTHIFELTSPWNRIVVPYTETHLNYLHSRNNETGRYYVPWEFEYAINMGDIPTPRMYNFDSLSDAVSFTRSETFNNFRNEGFVVWVNDEEGFHPVVKLKTEEYLRVHRLRGESSPTVKNIVPMVLENDYEEFLAYFPEYKNRFDVVRRSVEDFINEQYQKVHIVLNRFEDRKSIAQWSKENMKDMSVVFQVLDNKIDNDYHSIWNYYANNSKHVLRNIELRG